MHVIVGEDDFLVAEAAKKIVGDGVGLEVVDSLNSSNAELQLADLAAVDASVSTPPFLDPRKVTWWKNVGFLPNGGKRSASEAVKEALERFAGRIAENPLPDNQQLIISAPSLLKTSVFAKRLAEVAEVLVFAAGKPWQAVQGAVVKVMDYAAEMGLKFEPGVANHFVSIVGVDTRSLLSELHKIREYLGSEKTSIGMSDVNDITSQGVGVEPEVWDVTDAIGKRDLGAAIVALRKFELENGFAVFMSGIIEKFFRQLIDVKTGKCAGENSFAFRKQQDFARKWSLGELRLARARFLMLREKVVSGRVSGDVLIVNELVRACRGNKLNMV